jgi:hypothetical protein
MQVFNDLAASTSVRSAPRALLAAVRREAAVALCGAALLIVAVGWVVLAVAAVLIVKSARHAATSSVITCSTLLLRGWGWDVNMLLVSFGSRAVCVRPLALRARLATGVPLSGTCDGAVGGAHAVAFRSLLNALQETCRL